MGTELLQARLYDSDRDWIAVEAWAHVRGRPLIKAILPPLGIVVEQDGEPVSAAWCYMAVGIGVAWIEYVHTRPGLSMKEARAAILFVVEAIIAAAKANDYNVFHTWTMPAGARLLEKAGWIPDAVNKSVVPMAFLPTPSAP